jgi:hypothetical protein
MGNDERSRKNRLDYLDEFRYLITPANEGFFAGSLDRCGASMCIPNWIARLIPTIDLRKWKKIRSWA